MRPINQLVKATQHIARGDLAYRINMGTKDELGRFSNSFDMMVQSLQKSKKELQESRDYLDNIVESMGDILIVAGPDMTIRAVNRAACRSLGYGADELIGKNLDLIFREKEDVSLGLRELGKSPGEKPTWEYESDFISKHGRYISVLISAALMKDSAGAVMNIVCVAKDITERKKAEEKIESLKKQIEFILGSTKTGLDVIDSDFNIVFVDPEWAKIYGDYAGKKCYDYFAGRSEACPNCGIFKALETKKIVVTEEVLPKEGNRPIQVTTIPYQDESGKWFAAEVNVDITDRKEAEEKILQLNRLYSVLSNVNQAIVRIHDRARLFETVCRVAVEDGLFRMCWIGLFDTESLLPRPVSHWGFEEGFLEERGDWSVAAERDSYLSQIAKGGIPYFISNDIENDSRLSAWRDSALSRGYHSYAALPLKTGNDIVGVFNVYGGKKNSLHSENMRLLEELSIDISFALEYMEQESRRGLAENALRSAHNELETRVRERTAQLARINDDLQKEIFERKSAEDSMRKSKAEADIANKAKSEFLARMSHEIRTPMNAIIGFSELLEGTPINDEQKDYVDTICESGEVLLSLISDILDVSKIEAGELHLEKIDFDLGYLIRSVIRINSAKIKSKNIELLCVMDEKMPNYYKGDPTKIRQILINLLNNAIKFTEKGAIRISVKVKESLEVSEGRLRILEFSVKDSGIGIPKDKQQLIFEAFEQADTSTTRKFGGTGLGLTICKGLTQAMGGRIWIESEPEKGSEFFFTLPLEEAASIAKKDIFPVKKDELKGKKVLIVDDNAIVQRLIEFYCRSAGMNVVYKANSVEEAWRWLCGQPELPDIVLSDILMPLATGYELAGKIRKEEKTRHLKIIAVASCVGSGGARESMEAGFDAFVSKPIGRSELIMVIQTVMGDNRQSGDKKQIVTRHTAEELACKGMKILIAEDNAVNRRLLEIILKDLGCETDFAENGRIALEKIEMNHYDLVLMDLQMPVMGGAEATEIIRRQMNKTFPIIALTAAAMAEDREKGLSAGMNDFITKPFELYKLREKIVEWSQKSAAGPE